MIELYKNIKKYRIETKLTQQALAEKMGYKDKSMIAKIEKGLIDLPQSKIALFASVLGVTELELVGWEEKVATPGDVLLRFTSGDNPKLYVLQKKADGHWNQVNEVTGEEAVEIYKRLIGKGGEI